MTLEDLLFEVELNKLAELFSDGTLNEKEGQNNTVASWAKKLNMSYGDLHKVWEKAAEGKGKNYFAIMGAFKKAVTSLKGVTKKQLMDGGNAKFNYKVRTQQTVGQLLDDKPAPKNTNKAFVKKTKEKIKKLNTDIKKIKSQNSTPARKTRIKKLNDKKKELLGSLK